MCRCVKRQEIILEREREREREKKNVVQISVQLENFYVMLEIYIRFRGVTGSDGRREIRKKRK